MIQSRNLSVYWKLAAITLVGAAFRLYHLDAQSLWHDEAISVIVARAPLDRTLDFFRAAPSRLPIEYNPPLYAFLLHGWFKVLGVGGFEARLLSAVAGVVSLPLIFWLSSRLFGVSAGLYAAFLLAVSQLGVMFSQEARNYEVFMLLALATACLYWIAMSRRSLAAWCSCTVSAVLMVLTNYYGLFVILALAIYTVLYWRSIPLWWVSGAAAAGLVVLVPWLRFAFAAQVAAASDRVQPAYFSTGLSSIAGTIARFNNGAVAGPLESIPAWTLPLGAVLFGGPLIFLLGSSWRKASAEDDADLRATAFALLLWAVPLASVLTLGLVFNVQYNVRYVAFCIAPYYILVGAGLARLPREVFRRVAVAAVACFSGYALTASYRVPYKENYRDAIGFVTSQAATDDCYAFVPFGGPPLEWSIYASYTPNRLLKPDSGGEAGAGCGRIWVITYQRVVIDAHRRWRELIASATSGYTKRADRQFFWVRVERYDASPTTVSDRSARRFNAP